MKEKIKVLHILSTVTGGGVERRRLSLAKYLNPDKFKMKLVGTHKSGFIAEQIEAHGMEIVEVGDFNGPFHWEKHRLVQKIIDDFQPDIIHGAVYEGVTMAAVNGWLKKVPVVILEETSDPQNRSKKASFLLRAFSWGADAVVAIAPNVADYLTTIAKVNPRKVITINNGVEIPRTVATDEIKQLKEKYGIREGDFILGFVGRLFNDHKKVTDIFAALQQVQLPTVKVLIVGSGRDEEMIREAAEKSGISDQVIFAGYQFDTAPFYKLMHLFVISSAREGFGLVAAEAMLHHLPVLATRVGGLQNVVKDRETGFLVPPNSPAELADKIQYFYRNPQELIKMGEVGYARAMQSYTEERYVKEVEALYDQLIAKKCTKKNE